MISEQAELNDPENIEKYEFRSKEFAKHQSINLDDILSVESDTVDTRIWKQFLRKERKLSVD